MTKSYATGDVGDEGAVAEERKKHRRAQVRKAQMSAPPAPSRNIFPSKQNTLI